MNLSGWVMMIACVGGVTVFFATMVRLVLVGDRASKLHSDADTPPDIEQQ
jgi:hypothetical protein